MEQQRTYKGLHYVGEVHAYISISIVILNARHVILAVSGKETRNYIYRFPL